MHGIRGWPARGTRMVGGGGDVRRAMIRATHAEAERRADRPGGKFWAVTVPPPNSGMRG